MDEHSIDVGFPSISTSFQHQPHLPIYTLDRPELSLGETAADAMSPPLETSLEAPMTTPNPPTSIATSPWTTSIMPHHSHMPHIMSTSLYTAVPTSSVSDSADRALELPPAAQSNLSTGAKAGIFAGIAVVVLLAIMACVLGVLECRKQYKRRKARRQNRDSELAMLESEVRNVHAGQKRETNSGLWGHLKVETASDGKLRACYDGQQHVRNGSRTGIWERVGQLRYEEESDARRETSAGRRSDTGWHIPMDRTSVVSSVHSLTPSM